MNWHLVLLKKYSLKKYDVNDSSIHSLCVDGFFRKTSNRFLNYYWVPFIDTVEIKYNLNDAIENYQHSFFSV